MYACTGRLSGTGRNNLSKSMQITNHRNSVSVMKWLQVFVWLSHLPLLLTALMRMISGEHIKHCWCVIVMIRKEDKQK